MATYNVDAIQTPDGNVYDIKDTISGYQYGTVTSVETGLGLTGGPITNSGTIAMELKSSTPSSLTAAAKGSTSGREYSLGFDGDGDLSVNVPWTNTTYSAGTSISISSNKISVINVGAQYNKQPSANASVANLSATNLHYLGGTTGTGANQLPALGRYLLIGTATWSKNANGYREVRFSSSTKGSSANRYAVTRQATIANSSDADITQVTFCWTYSTTTDYIYLVGYQNSGATLTCSNIGICAIRLY